MKFQLRPIISEMKELYLKPISRDRFKEYIAKLQDNKSDLKLPISGFNPMAKEHVIQKLEELELLDAETIMDSTIKEFNESLDENSEVEIMVVLNLADDLKGAWTNFYTTDYDSKFKLNGIVNRRFCTPFFWTSEALTRELIKRRTKEYLNRTVYWLNNSKPKTLEEHIAQEIYVCSNSLDGKSENIASQFDKIDTYYLENKDSEDYDLIFNFLYGDAASENLGFKKYGMNGKTGLDYAIFMAERR